MNLCFSLTKFLLFILFVLHMPKMLKFNHIILCFIFSIWLQLSRLLVFHIPKPIFPFDTNSRWIAFPGYLSLILSLNGQFQAVWLHHTTINCNFSKNYWMKVKDRGRLVEFLTMPMRPGQDFSMTLDDGQMIPVSNISTHWARS